MKYCIYLNIEDVTSTLLHNTVKLTSIEKNYPSYTLENAIIYRDLDRTNNLLNYFNLIKKVYNFLVKHEDSLDAKKKETLRYIRAHKAKYLEELKKTRMFHITPKMCEIISSFYGDAELNKMLNSDKYLYAYTSMKELIVDNVLKTKAFSFYEYDDLENLLTSKYKDEEAVCLVVDLDPSIKLKEVSYLRTGTAIDYGVDFSGLTSLIIAEDILNTNDEVFSKMYFDRLYDCYVSKENSLFQEREHLYIYQSKDEDKVQVSDGNLYLKFGKIEKIIYGKNISSRDKSLVSKFAKRLGIKEEDARPLKRFDLNFPDFF